VTYESVNPFEEEQSSPPSVFIGVLDVKERLPFNLFCKNIFLLFEPSMDIDILVDLTMNGLIAHVNLGS
jgi:hypothetical protein